MEFFLIGTLERMNHEIQQSIQQMGGTVSKTIHKNLAAIISNDVEVQRMGDFMKKAKKMKIHVVSEQFLVEILKMEPIFFINNHAICDWGHDVSSPITIYISQL